MGLAPSSPRERATIRALPRLGHAPLPRPSTQLPSRAKGPGRAALWPDLIHYRDPGPSSPPSRGLCQLARARLHHSIATERMWEEAQGTEMSMLYGVTA